MTVRESERLFLLRVQNVLEKNIRSVFRLSFVLFLVMFYALCYKQLGVSIIKVTL